MSFDPVKGKGRVRFFRRKPRTCRGWAKRHKGTWYAIWVNNGKLHFQEKDKVFPMTDDFRCINVLEKGKRRFEIWENSKKIVSVAYKAYEDNGDPTYDNSDLELDDFFFWVFLIWNDKKRRSELASHWVPVFRNKETRNKDVQ